MLTKLIYKRDTLGKIRFWQAETSTVRTTGRSPASKASCRRTSSRRTRCTGKQGRTSEEQAVTEALSDQNKKLDREYRNTIADVDTKKSAWVKPMLGAQVRRVGRASRSRSWTASVAPRRRRACSPREASSSPPHIQWALEDVFGSDLDVVLDGEFYNHDYHDDFNAIVGARKRTAVERRP